MDFKATEDVRIETEGGPLAEDVDVALKLLTQRRREACEAKARDVLAF